MATNIFKTTGIGKASAMILADESSFAFINFVTFNKEFKKTNFPTALIQGVSLDQRTNHQIMLSLRQTIYLYVFGNQMGDVVVTGFLFAGSCDSESDGFKDVMSFYSKNRLSSTSEEVVISAGKAEEIKGFLTGLNILSTDITTLLTPFNMTIKTMPPTDQQIAEGTAIITAPPKKDGTDFLFNQTAGRVTV